MNCPSCGQNLDGMPPVCPNCEQELEYRTVSQPGDEGLESPWAPPRDGSGVPDADEPTAPLAATEPTIGLPLDHEPTAELPTNGFGDPSQYLAATHQPKVRQYLPVSPGSPDAAPWATAPAPQPAPKKRRRALPILLVALVLLVTGGGVAAAGYYLGWFGRGSQPSDVMPAATAAYMQVDLDPSLSQKSQAWAFLRDLPQVKAAVAAGQPDPKRMIWDALVDDGPEWVSGTDYDTDIKPWLGDRVGFGVLGHDEQPATITVIQVKDESVAAEKLKSWITASSQEYDVTTRNGYALVTAHADTDFVLGELEKGSLSSNQTFRSDMAALGDPGVFAGWSDLSELAKQGVANGSEDAQVQGRVAAALHFTADTLAFDGRFFGAGDAAKDTSEAGVIGELPETTGAAITISGGAKALQQLGRSVQDESEMLGLDQADLEAIFGRNITVSVPTSTMTMGASGSDVPAMGVRITTDDVARAQKALDKIPYLEYYTPQLVDHVDGDVLTVATTQDYLDELLQPASKLSGYDPFAKAVPDHAKATSAVYVNLTPLTTWSSDLGEYKDFITALQSFGVEVVPDGNGGGSWSVRLVRS